MKLIEGKDPVDYSKEELAQLSRSTLTNEVIPTYAKKTNYCGNYLNQFGEN